MTAAVQPLDWYDDGEVRWPVVVETKSFFIAWYPGATAEVAAGAMNEDPEWYEYLPHRSEAIDHDSLAEPADESDWAYDYVYRNEVGPRLPNGLFESDHSAAIRRAERAEDDARRTGRDAGQQYRLARPIRTVNLPGETTMDGSR